MKKLFPLIISLALVCAAFGQKPSPHPLKARVILTPSGGASVSLSWTQSSSSNITSNNVYRGTVAGGPYAEIYSSANLITSYTDSTVSFATTYYYVVTVVPICSPAESGYSNQAEAQVTAQGQPAPPSGLTATPTP